MHPDKASIAQALASLPSNVKNLSLTSKNPRNVNSTNGPRSAPANGVNGPIPNGSMSTPHSSGPGLTNGNGYKSNYRDRAQPPSPTHLGTNRDAPSAPQRVPNEDDFPTLGGNRPSLSSGSINSNGFANTHASTIVNGSGKTAAQILKSSLPQGAVSGKFRPRDGVTPVTTKATGVGIEVASAASSEKTTDVESLKSGSGISDQVSPS